MTHQTHHTGRKKRIFLYSHDTYGLGHIRRTLKIANTLVSSGEASVLIASASPKASSFFTREGIDFINLPGIIKERAGSYAPRDLDLSLPELINLRSDIFLSSVKSFIPDIILIDKEPLGVGGELLASIDFAHRNFKNCQIVAGFRDILDAPERVAAEWEERDTIRVLEKYFHKILVYGEREVFAFDQEYRLPESLKSKLHYTGYIDPASDQLSNEQYSYLPDFETSRALTLVTAGGGGDGEDLILPFVELLESGLKIEQNFILLTGPFLKGEIARRAWKLGERRSDVQVRHFISEPRVLMAQCQRIFCMGGYNTMCEAISEGARPHVLGRSQPRLEQTLRVKHFEALGWCQALNPASFCARNLEEILLTPSNVASKMSWQARGLTRIKDLFLGLSSS